MPDVHLKASDLNADSTWLLMQWCIERGSDEFSYICLGGAALAAPLCSAAESALEPFSLPPGPRPHLSRPVAEPFIRKTHLWRLNMESLAKLKELLPEGLFTDRQGNRDGWIENVTLYRKSELLLGIITHEDRATLRASDAEIRQLREQGLLPAI